MALSLYEKALLCEAVMEERHGYQGQVRNHVILPPAGLPDFSTGNHEDDAISTGTYLGTESFRWAVTREPKAKQRAQEAARALRKLQQVTGVRGCFARGFKRADKPTWDEQVFFFPREWHQAGKYRWVGDPSTDSLVGLMFGYELYYDLVADAKEKKEVAKDVEGFMGRIVEKGMRIVDVDGRLTLWGNMNPYILEENLNALEALSHLRGAYHMTKNRLFLREYRRLIEKWDYHKKAALANAQASPVPSPWDWSLATCPLYLLLQYEKDESLLRYYYRALEVQWKGVQAAGRDDPFYNWAYKALRPRAPIRKQTWDWLHAFEIGEPEHPGSPTPSAPKLIARRRKFEVVIDGRPRVIEGVVEGAPTGYLRAYWMGRYHGFIPPEA
jgi:hypothetical protein